MILQQFPAVVALAVALGCSGGELDRPLADEPCPRPPLPDSAGLREIDLELTDVACAIEFRDTRVQLVSDSSGLHPDPGRRVARDSRGRFFSANAVGFPSTVAVWDSAGAFLRTVGSPGPGPGELSARGLISIFVDARDRLHVRDGALQWSIFSPDLEFIQKVNAGNMGYLPEHTVVLDEGAVLTSQQVAADRAHDFHVSDFNGVHLRSFSAVIRSLPEGAGIERAVAYAGGAKFWAAPAPGDPRGYVLEEWTTQGTLLRVFRRTVHWFPSTPSRSTRPERSRPLVQVNSLHLDTTGLLMVRISTPNDRWRWVRDPVERERLEAQFYDGIVEIVDTRSAKVLVSKRMPALEAMLTVPRAFFPGQRSGYRIAESEDGLPVVKLVEYRLKRL